MQLVGLVVGVFISNGSFKILYWFGNKAGYQLSLQKSITERERAIVLVLA
jgi:hypothetical protein